MASNERSPWSLPSSEHPCSICPCTANMISTATLPQCNFLAYLEDQHEGISSARRLCKARQDEDQCMGWAPLRGIKQKKSHPEQRASPPWQQ